MRAVVYGLACLPGLAAAESGPGVSGGSFVQAFLGLALILVFLFGLAFAGKKLLRGARFGAPGLKLLGALALGPRERIVLVEAGETWLVIGLVPGQIRTLHRMPKGELPPETSPHSQPAFSEWLRRFLPPGDASRDTSPPPAA